MAFLADRQCRHPMQPMGGVCAVCLKERLSKISGLRCGPDAPIRGSATMIDWKPVRESPTLGAPPLKQLLGQPFDLSHHAEAAAEMPTQVMSTMSDDVVEARQSIAYLIERDIVEARPRHSDGASGCCYEPSYNQLPRSKSTSQLDAYYRLNGRSLHPVSSIHRQLLSGTKRTTERSMTSYTMKASVPHHDLQRRKSSPQCDGNGGMQPRFQLHEKTTLPLLEKSKSTGCILNHRPQAYDDNKRSERRSPVDLLSWHKRRKLSSALHSSMEALMLSPWTRKNGGTSSSTKTTETMWRPLKILFRWRVTSGKPSFIPPSASSSTPRSSYSSSSCTQCATEKKLHVDSISRRGDHAELEHVMCGMCGRTVRRVLSQIRGHSTLNAGGLDPVNTRIDADISVEQTSCYSQDNAVFSSPDVGSMQYCTVSHDILPSSALEQGGTRRRADVLLKRGKGTWGLARGSELSDSSMSCSTVMEGAKEEQVERSKSSLMECSVPSSLSSSTLPSLMKLFDTSMMYSNSKVKPSNACVVSIAALVSMDVNSTSPLKMACVGNT